MDKTSKDLGISILHKFKYIIFKFVECLHKDLILYSVESKLFKYKTICLNNEIYNTISDFMFYHQKYFDIDDYCDYETIIQYKSYSQYLELKDYMIYIDKMIESKQIKVNKNIYKQLKEILNRICRDDFKLSKNQIKSLQDLKSILDEINKIKIVY